MSEKIVNRETIYKGSFVDFEKVTVELSNGRTSHRDIVRHPGASAIVAIDESNNIILVSQYRTPLEKEILELPAGKLDMGEDPLSCAKRELKEETGYTAEKFVLLTSFSPSPAICDEIIHVYLAEELTAGNSCPDEGEDLTIKKIPLSQAKQGILKGEIIDSKTIIGIMISCFIKGI